MLLPGHGSPFTDVDLLAERLHSHGRGRAEHIAGSSRRRTRRSLRTTSPSDFSGSLRALGLVMGLANVRGHLDLLADAGRVVAVESGGAVSYRLGRRI